MTDQPVCPDHPTMAQDDDYRRTYPSHYEKYPDVYLLSNIVNCACIQITLKMKNLMILNVFEKYTS